MEALPDPLGDREKKDILPPPQKPLASDLLYIKKSSKLFLILEVPNLIVIYEHLQREGKILKTDFLDIINRFIEIVQKEPNVLTLQDPVTIVGDIHGQFYDVGKIMELGGDPQSNKYLFLGDYVDRGMFSIEVIIYLYCLKVINWFITYSASIP